MLILDSVARIGQCVTFCSIFDLIDSYRGSSCLFKHVSQLSVVGVAE